MKSESYNNGFKEIFMKKRRLKCEDFESVYKYSKKSEN